MSGLTLSLLCSVALAVGSAAPPPQNVEAAAEAFSNAQKAEFAHEYARAAEFYELADSLAPSPEALRSAAKNRLSAQQHAIAATHAGALLRRYPGSGKSREMAVAILDDAGPKLARVSARCDQPCVISSDGVVVADRALIHTFYLEPGSHSVAARFGEGQREETNVAGRAGVTLELSFEQPEAAQVAPVPAPPAPAFVPTATPSDRHDNDAPAPASRRRLSPAYFAAGAVVTAGLGATLAWSGADVVADNREYGADPTKARFDAGQSAERRTNALVGLTAAVGLTTIVLAVFTDWSRARSKRRASHRPPLVRVLPRGNGVSF